MHERKGGHDAVVVEWNVVAAEELNNPEGVSYGKPNRVKGKTRAFHKLTRGRSNQLTEDGARWMERVKTIIAKLLGGESNPDAPVLDEHITPLVAAGIIKGTELQVNNIDETKHAQLAYETATKATDKGGLGIPEAIVDIIDGMCMVSGEPLILVDMRGTLVECVAKPGSTGFVNTYYRALTEEETAEYA